MKLAGICGPNVLWTSVAASHAAKCCCTRPHCLHSFTLLMCKAYGVLLYLIMYGRALTSLARSLPQACKPVELYRPLPLRCEAPS